MSREMQSVSNVDKRPVFAKLLLSKKKRIKKRRPFWTGVGGPVEPKPSRRLSLTGN